MTWSQRFDENRKITEAKWRSHLPRSLDPAVKSIKDFLAKVDGLQDVPICLLTRSAVEPDAVGGKPFLKVTNSSDARRDLGFRGLDILEVTEKYAVVITDPLTADTKFRTFRCFTDYFNGGSFMLRRCAPPCAPGDAAKGDPDGRLCIKRYGESEKCLSVAGNNEQKTLADTAIAYFLACEVAAKKLGIGNITLVAVGATDDPEFPPYKETIITACYVVFSTEQPFVFSRGDWLIGGLINSVLEALLRGHQNVLEHNDQWRRSALRTAVSAIMGRNMSHNIGSHVLARYSSRIRDDRDPAKKGYTDHRGDFLNYLQQRMDFIAEVSTSDRSHWAQSLSLKDALARLNYEAQKKRFEQEGTGKYGTPILLSYITGKESLTASVAYEGDDSLAFACPSGEIGLHALYIILENVIRNSARHGSPHGSEVRITVLAEDKPQENEIELTIVDPGTVLTAQGYAGHKRLAVPAVSDNEKESVIEAVLRASLLQDSGEPDPKNWGVREMQICAHYLLARPLSELDGAGAAEVLTPSVHPLSGEKHCLAYKLRLRKPKNILVLTKQPLERGEACCEKLQRNGIVCYDQVRARELASNQRLAFRDYDFLIVEQDNEQDDAALAPPTNLTDWGDGLDTLLCPRRVGITKDNIEDLLKCDLDIALTGLHRCVAEQYQYPAERSCWHAPIASVAGWDKELNPLPGDSPPEHLSHKDAASPKQYWHIDTGLGDPTHVISPFPAEIGGLRESRPANTDPDICGIAWLDHAADDKFKIDNSGEPAAPYFAGAAVPCKDVDNYWSGVRIPQVSRWIAVEPMWSDSPHTALLKKIKAAASLSVTEWKAHGELVCAALPRVVVLDERVQSRRFDKVRDVSLFKYWPHVGIWTPFKDADEPRDEADGAGKAFIGRLGTPPCDLDQPKFEEIRAFLKCPSPLAHQGNADFLVVHLTILEKLQHELEKLQTEMNKGDGRVKLDQVLNDLTAGTRAQDARRIVVTGRGVPSQLRHNHHDNNGDHGDLLSARFVPVSALLEYLVQRPSKLGLMRVLWSA